MNFLFISPYIESCFSFFCAPSLNFQVEIQWHGRAGTHRGQKSGPVLRSTHLTRFILAKLNRTARDSVFCRLLDSSGFTKLKNPTFATDRPTGFGVGKQRAVLTLSIQLASRNNSLSEHYSRGKVECKVIRFSVCIKYTAREEPVKDKIIFLILNFFWDVKGKGVEGLTAQCR